MYKQPENTTMNGSTKYSDLGSTTTAAANPSPVAAAVAAVDNDDDYNDESAGVLLVAAAATPVPMAAAKTERIEVVSPASLPGGYELHCDFRGQPVVIRVVRRYCPAASFSFSFLSLPLWCQDVSDLYLLYVSIFAYRPCTHAAPRGGQAGTALRGRRDPRK